MLKLSALSADAQSEEPIDFVMRNCFPDKVQMTSLKESCCIVAWLLGSTDWKSGVLSSNPV